MSTWTTGVATGKLASDAFVEIVVWRLHRNRKADPSRVRDRADDDAPLLALVDDGDPVALLEHALTRLVERVGSLRAESRTRQR